MGRGVALLQARNMQHCLIGMHTAAVRLTREGQGGQAYQRVGGGGAVTGVAAGKAGQQACRKAAGACRACREARGCGNKSAYAGREWIDGGVAGCLMSRSAAWWHVQARMRGRGTTRKAQGRVATGRTMCGGGQQAEERRLLVLGAGRWRRSICAA